MDPQLTQNELSFRDLSRVLLNRWRLMAMVMASVFLFSVIYLHLITYRYTAVLQVTPTQSQSGSSQLSGLASIAGINLSQGQSVAPFVLYTENARSRAVAARLTENLELMKVVFGDQWNPNKEQWQAPDGIVQSIMTLIKRALGIPIRPWQPPGPADMERYLRENVALSTDISDPIATFVFRHPDPQFAKRFLEEVHATSDKVVRERTLERTRKYIGYLSEKLGAVSVAEHRQALAESLAEQERVNMMASSDVDFAAEPFGEAAVSAAPNSPNPWLVLGLALFVGVLMGGLSIAVVEYLSVRKSGI